jgi:hypothetical protein
MAWPMSVWARRGVHSRPYKTEKGILLTCIQSRRKDIRRSHDTLPGSQVRRRLHHLNRALTHGLSRL